MGIIPAGVAPGDFFCIFTNSDTSKWVALGEWLNGDRFARTAGKQFIHSGVVVAVQQARGAVPQVTTVEAQPHGGVQRMAWHYGKGAIAIWSTGVITIPRPAAVAEKAEALVGTPYGFLNYPAIGFRRLGIPAPWLDRYIASERSMICSEVTDISVRAGGLVMIPDRSPGFITPQEQADYLMDAGAVPVTGG